jgi:hypothetical protein
MSSHSALNASTISALLQLARSSVGPLVWSILLLTAQIQHARATRWKHRSLLAHEEILFLSGQQHTLGLSPVSSDGSPSLLAAPGSLVQLCAVSSFVRVHVRRL